MKRSSSSDGSDGRDAKRSRDSPKPVMEGQSQSSQAQLCRNGCGFYGNSKTDGMCSICYKDSVQKKNNSGRKSPSVTHVVSKPNEPASSSVTSMSSATSSPIDIPSAANPSTSLTSPSAKNSSFDEAGTSLDDSPSPSKPKKNRCASCRKRLGLTGFDCRCGKVFCGLHRYSDQHNCEFDYKADGQAKIRKENPMIVGEKINKI